MPSLSPFPPSFEDNPWSYGAALFAFTLISALSLAKILTIANDATRLRKAAELVGAHRFNVPDKPIWSPLTLYRAEVLGFCVALFSTTVGDVFILLAWHGASATTMLWLFAIDWGLDAFAVLPFMVAFAAGVWSSQTVPHSLEYPEPLPVSLPKWPQLKRQAKIVAATLFIAAGVTLAKAGVTL